MPEPLSRQNSKKLMTQAASKPGSPEGSATRKHQARSGAGTTVEAGLGMDNFVDGCVSLYFARRFTQNGMCGIVC
jgi:hypothetical protein